MKIFFSEYITDYLSYTFSYTAYCIKENQEEIPIIYEKGFLPYSGNLTIEKDIFYLARGLRVNLERFDDTSENKRINRKINELQIEISVIEKSNFSINDKNFLHFCTGYADERFAGGRMTLERLEYILSRESLTHIIVFRNQEHVFGYVLACLTGGILHYWFSFFDTAYLQTHSLGKWMMWRTIRWAKDQNMQYIYLGTCYLPKSLYKVRDHKGIEFFDGAGWNPDVELLKYLCQSDDQPREVDFFKSKDEKIKLSAGFIKEISQTT
jgi:arginine-tRNA-protein transferase